MKKVLNIFLALTMIVSLVMFFSNGTTFAKNEKEKFTKQELENRFNQIHNVLAKVHTGKLTQQQAEKILNKMNVYRVNSNKNNNNIVIQSEKNEAVELPTPDTWYDYGSQHYYTSAHFMWNQKKWIIDIDAKGSEIPNIWYPMKGYDGFGIAFSRPINRVTQTFTVFDDLGNAKDYRYPDGSSNQYGVVFLEQDQWKKDSSGNKHYNWDSGYMGLYWNPQEPGKEYSISQSLAHTWNNTIGSINGIGWGSISWSFSNTNYGWSAVPEEAENFTPEF